VGKAAVKVGNIRGRGMREQGEDMGFALR